MEIFKITVLQMLTIKPCVVGSYTPSGATALTTARTVKGIIEGEGTYNNTSCTKETSAVALPSTPFASVKSRAFKRRTRRNTPCAFRTKETG